MTGAMADQALLERTIPRWRTIAFAVVAGLITLLVLFLLDGSFAALGPWEIVGGGQPGWTPEINRWHGAEHGASFGFLIAGSLIALLWRTGDRPLLLHDADGSWGAAGGVLALLAGASFIAATLWETRWEAPVSPSGSAG